MAINVKLSFIVLILPLLLFSQEAQNLLQSSEDPLVQFQNIDNAQEKFKFFFDTDNLFVKSSPYDWLETLNVYIDSSKKTNDSITANFYKTLSAELYYRLNDYPKSLAIANELYDRRSDLTDEHLEVLLNLLDKNYQELSMYDRQIEIRELKRSKGFTNKVQFYDVYEAMGLYRRAMENYIMDERVTPAENDFLGKAIHRNKIGNYLRMDNSPSTAINEFNKASGFLEVYNNDISTDKTPQDLKSTDLLSFQIKGNIGKSLVDLGEADEALTYLNESIAGLKKINETENENEVIENTLSLAQAYLDLGNLRTAKRLLDSQKKLNTIKQEQKLNRLMGTYYNKIQNYKSAATYYQKNDRILDSIEKNDQSILKQQLGVIIGNSDVESQLSQMQAQQDELEMMKSEVKNRDERFNLVIISLIFTLLGFAGLIFAYLNSIKNQRLIEKQKFIIEDSLKEKESLLKEIHHRVKNNLQMVSSLLSLQTKNTKNKSAILALEEGKSRVKAMALIHQKLYQNEDLSVIEMQGYIESLINSVQSVYKKGGHNISITIDAEGTELDIDRAIPFGLILNELVSNTFKYAFPESDENGKIYIHLRKNGKGGYFEYSDNGIGLPKGVNERTNSSMGIRLINRLVNQLQSTLNIDQNSDGVRFWFSFI